MEITARRLQLIYEHPDIHERDPDVEEIPEGFVTELAGVRQAGAALLLAAGGHAQVAAAVGHLGG